MRGTKHLGLLAAASIGVAAPVAPPPPPPPATTKGVARSCAELIALQQKFWSRGPHRYTPHQGERECARRLRQRARGDWEKQ